MVDRGIKIFRITFLIGIIIMACQIILPIAFNSPPKLIADASELSMVNPTLEVHLTGAIKNPGIYHLPKGARIMDAIVKAGGTVKEASLNSLNLAEVLKDGERIYVPTKQEELTKNTNASPDIKPNQIKNPTIKKVNNNNISKININNAGIDELSNLPSIGPKIAKSIIEYRQKNGKFKQIEELKNIRGIGEKRFNRLKELITIQ